MEINKSKLRRVSFEGFEDTFDLTVDEDHSYVANGVVTHNTTRYKHVKVN